MTKDVPEDKYDFRIEPGMCSFGAVVVHIAAGNSYAAKAGHCENVHWGELDPKDYKTKATAVALLQKPIADRMPLLRASRTIPSRTASAEPQFMRVSSS